MPRVDRDKVEVEQERREKTEEETEDDEGGGAETEEQEGGGSEQGGGGVEKKTKRYIVMPITSNLSDEEKDRVADPNQLQEFALFELQSLRLADLVTDAMLFERVYSSQKFWFCHFCGSYFSDGDSLIMHLKIEHIPSIAECPSWPSLLDKQDREFVQGSISKMVWKPINVDHAIQHFYELCHDARLAEVELWELPWPWTELDPMRSRLLSKLEKVLKELASDENGLTFLSSGPLRHLISIASRHILVHLPRRDLLVFDFARQLASSPLSFCFLEEESLHQFVNAARRMRNKLKTFSALDKCNSTSCNMSSDSSVNYRLSCQLNGKVYFVLGPESCQDQNISDIPCSGPLQLPSEPPKFLSEFLAQLDLCSDLFSKLIMEERISCLYTVYDNISTTWSYLGLLRLHKVPCKTERPAFENSVPFKTERSAFENSVRRHSPVSELEIKRKNYLYQADMCGLQFVEELCTLQCLEFEIRRLCIFEFRSYIVPLMQRFLQRSSSLSPKEEKLAAGFGCSENTGGRFADQTPSNAFKHVNKDVYHSNTSSLPISGKTQETDNSSPFSGGGAVSSNSSLFSGGSSCSLILSSAFKHMNKKYHPNMHPPLAGCGDQETDNSGIFICVHLGSLMDDIGFHFETFDVVREAMYYLRIHKTWRYWYCYLCYKRFLNRESHMKHMEDMHNFNLPCDEQSRLVPRSPSKHEVDQLLGVKGKIVKSSFLQQPNRYTSTIHGHQNIFYNDLSSKIALLESVKIMLYSILENKTVPFLGSDLVRLVEFSMDQYFQTISSGERMTTVKKIDNTTELDFSMYNTHCLQCVWKILDTHKDRTPVEIQTHESTYFSDFASCGIFFEGSYLKFDAAKFAEAFPHAKKEAEEKKHPFISNYNSFLEIKKGLIEELETLKGKFDKKLKVLRELDEVFALDRMLMRVSDHAEMHRSIYKILDSLCPAPNEDFKNRLMCPLCFGAPSCKVLKMMKIEIFSRLVKLDIKIMKKVARINKLKIEMSDLCFWDYSTDILLVIGVFLKPRIRVDGDLAPWASNKLHELLRSIDHLEEYKSFRITSVSIGEVFVNIRDKWGLGFDYKRMRLNFEGEWESVRQEDRYSGYVDFDGLSDWDGCTNEDMEVEATVVFTGGKTLVHEVVLVPLLRKAICAKLLQFEEAFIEKNDVCILGRDRMSDCMREQVWEYFCLNKRHHQKENFEDENAGDSTSSSSEDSDD